MIQQARDFWAERSQREQWMLGVMFGLLGAVILWFGIISPIFSGLDSAKTRHAQAVSDLATVQTKAAALRRLKANPPPPLGAPVNSFVSLSAGEVGFQLARVDAVGTDGVTISIVSAKPAAFFSWISALVARGIFVDQINIRPNSDMTIGIDATLKARPQ